MPTRRAFLRQGLILVTVGAAAPAFLAKTGVSTQTPEPVGADVPAPLPAVPTSSSARPRSLVVIQLSGGNDGLNTVIPYADPLYGAARPLLAVPEGDVLPLDDALGLHPALA